MDDKILSPLYQNVNPAVFQLPTLPPFCVPPEDFDLWTDQNEREFKFWQGGKQITKDDYMDFLHTINKEYDMDDVFNKLEQGLEAFEKLASCMNIFPNYDLNKDLEESYIEKENAVMIKFIKTGFKFLKKNDLEVKNFIAYIKSNEEEASDNIIDKSGHSQQDEQAVRLSQLNSDAAISNEDTENVEVDFQVVKRKKKARKKKCKEKKVQRLLQYHLKLVEERGLPPSRLMQQHQLQTPKHSSSETCSRRNLLSEFGKLGRSGEETHQVPTKAAVVGSHSGSEEAVHGQSIVNENRISSGFNSPSLYSFSQPLEVSGNAGGSDARTLWMTPQQQGWTGVSSGYMQQSSLCSSPVTCLVWNPPVCQPTPTLPLPPCGQPAYCSSCMLFGNVFTVSPV